MVVEQDFSNELTLWSLDARAGYLDLGAETTT
jgi:hypothetical protein